MGGDLTTAVDLAVAIPSPSGSIVHATIPRVSHPPNLSLTNASDESLVRRVLGGDPAAEEELVRRYRGLIIGLARSRFGFNDQQTDELLQTIVAMLWRDDRRVLRAWRGQSKLSTYLSVIVCRHCRQWLDSEQRRRAMETSEPPAVEPVDSAALPDAETLERERSRALKAALALLNPRDRLVISFRFFDELEPHDFAPTLGLSTGAARKAVHDALRRLRSKLGPDLFPESGSEIAFSGRGDDP